jgi:hypothetical protein
MRTRRIAIGCRRTGSVAIAPSGSADPVSLVELVWPPNADWPPQLDLLPHGDLPGDAHRDALLRGELPSIVNLPPLSPAPLPLRRSGLARTGGALIPTPTPPSPGDQDLTLADLTTGRRDLSWNDNPGWPTDVGWSTIARAARGHSPKHARRGSPRAFIWTGAGVITAILLTILITTVSELMG